MVRVTPKGQRPSDADMKTLQAITHDAFGQRRKMLKSSLKALGGAALCEAAGINPEARAETVDVAGFLALARAANA